ncbi:MAG: 30S ribosomal protein S13 [Candidatus Nanoarchaeia archaeon]
MAEKQEQEEVRLIRILSHDIPGNMKVRHGLTKIKGISWSFSNALCNKFNIDREKRIQDLSDAEKEKISEGVKNPPLPGFMLNRHKDLSTGQDKHLHGSDLEVANEFDIKRLRQIKSYKGIRHGAGLPVRGQRTKANFRKNKRKGAVGVSKAGKKRV